MDEEWPSELMESINSENGPAVFKFLSAVKSREKIFETLKDWLNRKVEVQRGARSALLNQFVSFCKQSGLSKIEIFNMIEPVVIKELSHNLTYGSNFKPFVEIINEFMPDAWFMAPYFGNSLVRLDLLKKYGFMQRYEAIRKQPGCISLLESLRREQGRTR